MKRRSIEHQYLEVRITSNVGFPYLKRKYKGKCQVRQLKDGWMTSNLIAANPT